MEGEPPAINRAFHPGSGEHRIYPGAADIRDVGGHVLVTSYAWGACMLSVAQQDVRKSWGPPARNNAESMDASRVRRARSDAATRAKT